MSKTRASIRTYFTSLIFDADGDETSAEDDGKEDSALPTPKHYGDPLDIAECTEEKVAAHSDIEDMLRLWGMLEDPAGDPNVFYSDSRTGLRNLAISIVRNRHFEQACGLYVSTSVFLIAIDLDYYKSAPSLSWLLWLTLSITNSMELTLRVLALKAQAFRGLLILDAVACVAAWLVMPLQGVDEDSAMLSAAKSLGVLRVCRLQAFLQSERDVDYFPPLSILAQAVRDSVQPLCSVLVLTLLFLLSLALMLTSLVPGAVEDLGEAETEVVLEYFGDIPVSCFTLLEVMAGAGDYGLDVAAALWVGAAKGSSGTLMMLVSLGAACFFIRVAFNALVIGIFLERLFEVSDHEQERVRRKVSAGHHQFFARFLDMFQKHGYEVSDLVSWAQVSAVLEALPDVKEWLPKGEASRLFASVDDDDDGLVQADQFVFGAFQLKGFSDSVDMRAINYQQKQTVQKLRQLSSDFDLAVAGMQSRLFHIRWGLAAVDVDLGALHQGTLQVQDLVAELKTKRQAVADLASAEKAQEVAKYDGLADLSVPRQLEELRARTNLSRYLDDVLLTANTSLEVPASDASNLVEEVADAVVRSVRSSLQQELSELRATAAAPGAMTPLTPPAPVPAADSGSAPG